MLNDKRKNLSDSKSILVGNDSTLDREVVNVKASVARRASISTTAQLNRVSMHTKVGLQI